MADNLFAVTFETLVPSDGFEWVSGFDPTGDREVHRYLYDPSHRSDGRKRRIIRPLVDHSGLFREFADIANTQQAITAFANRFGWLGVGERIVLGDPSDRGPKPATLGERSLGWHREIIAMRQCIALIDAVQDEDHGLLGRYIHWRGDRVDYESVPGWKPGDEISPENPPSFTHIASRDVSSAIFRRFEQGDLVQPALAYIQKIVNRRLEKHTSMRMYWAPETGEMRNLVNPSNLLGAMWLQFAIALENKSRFRKCTQCGKWFELLPSVGRSDKQFCSSTCRVRAFRDRKAESGEKEVEKETHPPATKKTKRNAPARGRKNGR